MKLEQIINSVKEQSSKTARKAALYAMVAGAGALGITGCENQPVINPLGPSINGTVEQSQGYKFSNDAISASITPTERPFQKVLGHYQRPNESWTSYQEITDADADGKYDISLSSTPFPGDYNFQFKTVSGDRETESPIATVPVYMNEEQSDAAAVQAAQELGIPTMVHNSLYYQVHGTSSALTVSENEMMSYTGPNFDDGVNGVTDLIIGVKKSNPIRGPPGYEGFYYTDIKGSESDVFSQAKSDSINANSNGCDFSGPYKTKDEIKERLQQLKAAGWPQIVP